MADEPKEGAVAVEEKPTPAPRGRTPAPPKPPEPVPAPAISFEDAMAVVTAKENRQNLETHPVITGLAGNIAQRQSQAAAEEQTRAAQQRAENELLELAEKDPDAFAAKFISQKQADAARSQLQDLHNNAMREAAAQVGRSVQLLPEDERPTPAQLAEIAESVKNLPEDQVIPTFTSLVASAVGDRKAEKQEARIRAEEREAAEASANATRTRRTPAPDLRPPTEDVSDEPDFRRDPVGWTNWNNERRRQRRIGA